MFFRIPSRGGGRTRTRGQSLVELAFIAPVMLLLLLTAIDLGRLLYAQITITNAAKEGALVASQGGTYANNQPCSPTNEVMCGVLTEAEGGFVQVEQARVTVSPATCAKNATYPAGGPPTVTVSVAAPFRVVTPIIGSIVGSNLVLGSTAEAECLVVPEVTFPSLPDPTALFTANPTSGTAPLDVAFDATASSSPGATISDYSWSFGASGATASHTFPAGTHTVVLTVTDSRGQTATASSTITVTGGPPPPSCPTLDFTWRDRSNPGNPHRMELSAVLTPTSSGWTFVWTGAWNPPGPVTGASPTVHFNASGSQPVSVTATKDSCSLSITKDVPVP